MANPQASVPTQNVNPNAVVGRAVPAGEPLISLKFNHRYKNINQGEIAGFPRLEAEELLSMRIPGTGKMVAEPAKRSERTEE